MDPTPVARHRFDRGLQHFNERAFFEAHEDWEDLWRESLGEEKRWLQGLIQIAAAFVHFERGFHASGFATLLREGHEKVIGYEGDTWHLDMARALETLAPWFEHGRAVAAGADLCERAPHPLPQLHHVAGYAPRPPS